MESTKFNNSSFDKLSISMIIDNNTTRYNTTSYTVLPLKNSININQRRIYSWTKDENVLACTNCYKLFNFFFRKHHCRYCGKIFCFECSNYFIHIPDNIKIIQEDKNLLNLTTYISFFNKQTTTKDRVCKHCFEKLTELQELNKLIYIFNLLPLDINDYRIIAQVCKSWNIVALYYISNMREIQYCFSDHKYTNIQKDILLHNQKYLTSHSKWLLHLIMSTEWDDNNKHLNDHLLNIIRSNNKSMNCWNMLCTRSCKTELECDDIILILSKKYIYYPLMCYLFEKLNNYNATEIVSYINFLVELLNFYNSFKNIETLFRNLLLNISKQSIIFANKLFWCLTQQIEKDNNYQYFRNLRMNLVNSLGKTQYKQFQDGYDFTINLIQLIQNTKQSNSVNIDYVKKYFYDFNLTNKKQYYLPVIPDSTFNNIDVDNIRIIDSKTRPMIIPCKYDGSEKRKLIMLKPEDVRKEECIMQIIRLMAYFLKIDEGEDFYIKTYNILPISSQYGYIEFVEDAYTLYSIREEYKFTIQNFIMEINPHIDIYEFKNRFTRSCAAYCVITYLLGVGDRHLDNILITKDGCVFHIDYAYILGSDPKILCPEIRIPYEIVDALGGVNSSNYALFKDYCSRIYNCLRRRYSIIYTLLSSIVNSQPPVYESHISQDYIKKHIIDKFLPGETYQDASLQLCYKIDNNINTYSENIIDYFHKKFKSPIVSSIVSSAVEHSKKITTLFKK